MWKCFLSLFKKDCRMMISGKFFLVAFCSLILYTLFINFGYVNFMDAKLYNVYLYDPEGTQREVSSLIHPVSSIEEFKNVLFFGNFALVYLIAMSAERITEFVNQHHIGIDYLIIVVDVALCMMFNMTLLLQCDLSQKIKITGLTAERMAAETCLLFFDGEHYPQEAYALCQKLLEVYHHFSVRLEDETGILDYLYSRLEVQNIRTYQILYERDQSKEGHRKWFLIDLTDQKWHSLQQIMKADEFEDWVLKTLEEKNYTSEELKQYLSIYTALTGEEITKIFWKCNKYSLHFLFSRFVEWGYLHPKDLLEQYLRDSETPGREVREKWFHMVYYLQQYVKGLRSQEAYDL